VNDKFILIERSPTTEEYRNIRQAIGWGDTDAEATCNGLSNSLFSVCVEFENSIIGCGRIIGNGGIYFYIQDVIVLPDFQRRGVGTQIMNSLLTYIRTHAHTNSFIGLMAAKEAAGFYERFGFGKRPSNGPGMFMIIE